MMVHWSLAALIALISPALALEPPSCANPRAAADSLLAWLQPDSYDTARAATCLNLSPDQDGPELALELKKVLDARGYWIPVSELSTDPNAVDEEGRSRIALVGEALPQAYLEKVEGRWLWSSELLSATPRLYEETFSGLGARLQLWIPPFQIGGLELWQAVYFIGMILVGSAASLLINVLLRRQVLAWVARLGLHFNPELFDRTRGPMRLLALGLVIYVGAPDLQLPIRPSRALLFLSQLAVSLGVVVIAIRWIDVFAEIFQERATRTKSRMDDQLIPLLGQAAKLAAVLLGLVFILQNLDVDVGGLITGLGIGGLAFALAAQNTLANLFGSLTIFLDRPFQLGDWVVLEGGVEGTVEEIGFRSTRIRAFTDSIITVPNARMTSAHVENLGARQYRRIKTVLGLTYDTPPDRLQAMVEGIRAVIAANPHTRKDYYEVHFQDFGASSLDILVYCFLEVPTWHDELVERSRLFLEILRLAEHLGVAFAFPSQSVYLESVPGSPVAAREPLTPEALRARIDAFGPGGSAARPGGPALSHGYNAGADSARGGDG